MTAAPATPAAELVRGIPAYWLRVAVAVAVAGIGIDLAFSGTHLVLLFAALVVGAGCVLWPGSPAAMVLIAVVALGVAPGADPFSAGVLLLVPLLHLLHLACAHAALVPVAARVHPAALRPALLRAAGVQVVAFLLVGLGAALPSAPDDVLVVGLAAASCIAIVLILVRLTRRA